MNGRAMKVPEALVALSIFTAKMPYAHKSPNTVSWSPLDWGSSYSLVSLICCVSEGSKMQKSDLPYSSRSCM